MEKVEMALWCYWNCAVDVYVKKPHFENPPRVGEKLNFRNLVKEDKNTCFEILRKIEISQKVAKTAFWKFIEKDFLEIQQKQAKHGIQVFPKTAYLGN